MVDTCDINATEGDLDIIVEGGGFVGGDINVTIYDENGNPIDGATIQFIAPDGRILSYEEGFKLYEKGKWAVMADKTGYAGNYVLFDVETKGGTKDSSATGVLGSVADAVGDFFDWVTESGARSVLLLVAVIIAAFLIVTFAAKKRSSAHIEKI